MQRPTFITPSSGSRRYNTRRKSISSSGGHQSDVGLSSVRWPQWPPWADASRVPAQLPPQATSNAPPTLIHPLLPQSQQSLFCPSQHTASLRPPMMNQPHRPFSFSTHTSRPQQYRQQRVQNLDGPVRPFITHQPRSMLRQSTASRNGGRGLNRPSSCATQTRHLVDPVPREGLSPDFIQDAVDGNNAFQFGQSLLAVFGSTEGYQRSKEAGFVDLVCGTIAVALRKHVDAPMFILNALITVGTVGSYKDIEPEYEYVLSQLLVESLRLYVQWYQDQAPETLPAVLNIQEGHSKDRREICADTVCVDQNAGLAPLRPLDGEDDGGDLIQLEEVVRDPATRTMLTTATGSLSSRPSLTPQITRPFAIQNLLDDDSDLAKLNQETPPILLPAQPNLIDLSNWDCSGPDTGTLWPHPVARSNSVCSSRSQITIGSITSGWSVPIEDDYLYDSEGTDLRVSLWQLNEMNQILERGGLVGGETDHALEWSKSDILQLVEVFKTHRWNVSNGLCIESQLQEGVTESEENMHEDYGESEQDRAVHLEACKPITESHWRILLDQISSGKNVLQVFVALDVYGMQHLLTQSHVSQFSPCDVKEEYNGQMFGSVLARKLFDAGRIEECSVVVSRYMHHHPDLTDLESKLILRLFELDDIMAIQDYINEDMEVCDRILYHINHQLSFQIYYWGLATPEMVKTDPVDFQGIDQMAGIGKAKTQTRLVELAESLIMRYDLEGEDSRFGFLSTFKVFCTVVTLLAESPLPHDGGSAVAGAKGQRMGGVTASSTAAVKGMDYSLKNRWKFFPVVLGIIRDRPILQMMTIHYLLEKNEILDAKFFATKLGLADYLADNIDDDQEGYTGDQGYDESEAEGSSTAANASSLSGPRRKTRNKILSELDDSSDTSLPAHLSPSTPYYRLLPETRVVMVNRLDQLDELKETLRLSEAVGMDTEWLPRIPSFEALYQGARTSILQLACRPCPGRSFYLHRVDHDGEGSSDGLKGDVVFLVDVLAFLEGGGGGQDIGGATMASEKLCKVLGEMFSNPKILKLAYDWDGDQELLETTFPILTGPEYRLQNITDLKRIWFRVQEGAGSITKSNSQGVDGGNNINSYDHGEPMLISVTPPGSEVVQLPGMLTPGSMEIPHLGGPLDALTGTISESNNGGYIPGVSPGSSIPGHVGEDSLHLQEARHKDTHPRPSFQNRTSKKNHQPVATEAVIEGWTKVPSLGNRYMIVGGLSGLLTKLCGVRLDKAQRLSQWEQRPLVQDQVHYAAADAKCLLEIYDRLCLLERD